ncbi:hypothetical protein SpCBS45565_g00107 [Spizellomyces sp. 'palustris']|nr:hypothetical protein SpCBS45565_g00107 [Spizellomyces sp. 'palustris']
MLASPNPLDRRWRQEVYKQRSALQSKHPRPTIPTRKQPTLPPTVISAAQIKHPPTRHQQQRQERSGLSDLSGRRRCVCVSRPYDKVTPYGTPYASRNQSMFDEQVSGTIHEARSPNTSDTNKGIKKAPISTNGHCKTRTSQSALDEKEKLLNGYEVGNVNRQNVGPKSGMSGKKKRTRVESREPRKNRKQSKLDKKVKVDPHSKVQGIPPTCVAKKPLIHYSDNECPDVNPINTNTPPRNPPNKPKTNTTQPTSPDILSDAERFSDFDPFWIPDWMPPPHNDTELYSDDDVSEQDVLAMLHDPHDNQNGYKEPTDPMRDDEKNEIVRYTTPTTLNKRRYSGPYCALAIDMTNPAVKTAEDVYKALSITHDSEPKRECPPKEIKMEFCGESKTAVKLESTIICEGACVDAKRVGLDDMIVDDGDASEPSGPDKPWFDARQCADEFISKRDIPPKAVLIYILHVMVESMMRFRLIRRTRWNVSHIVSNAVRDGYTFSVDKLVQVLQAVDQQDTWEKMTECNHVKDRLWDEGYTNESREIDLVDWYDDRNDGDGPLKSIRKMEDALSEMDEQWRRVCGNMIKNEKRKPSPRPAEITSRSFYGSYGTKEVQKRMSPSKEECDQPLDSQPVKMDISNDPTRTHNKNGNVHYNNVQSTCRATLGTVSERKCVKHTDTRPVPYPSNNLPHQNGSLHSETLFNTLPHIGTPSNECVNHVDTRHVNDASDGNPRIHHSTIPSTPRLHTKDRTGKILDMPDPKESYYDKMVLNACRPGMYGYPLVWCQNRQELAEGYALDRRFIQYQCGYQMCEEGGEKVTTAILLGGFPAERDAFSPYAFITHAGGKKTLTASGYTISGSQSTTDKNVAGLLAAQKLGKHVMVIVGKEYSVQRIVPDGIGFAVLGYFLVTHAWGEYVGGNVRFKFRFELVRNQEHIWHIEPQPIVPKDVHLFMCTKCGETSPWVYTVGMCLRVECEVFWKVGVEGGYESPGDLVLRSGFLDPSSSDGPPARSVIPLQPTPEQCGTRSVAMWCERCGRISRRVWVYKWYTIEIPIPIYTRSTIRHLPPCPTEQYGCRALKPTSRIRGYLERVPTHVPRFGGWERMVYVFPEGGQVLHFLAGGREDLDGVYEGLQRGRFGFRRMGVKSRLNGLLTSNFVLNSGEAYAQASTLPARSMTDNAPIELEAIQWLQDAVHEFGTVYNQSHKNLSLADDEKEMHWHDDGEHTVHGPVSSQSLGSDALMLFRTKPTKTTKPNTVLTLAVRHGDVVIMVGKAVQRYYEHCVRVRGHRVSVTARTVVNSGTVLGEGVLEALEGVERGVSRGNWRRGRLVFGCEVEGEVGGESQGEREGESGGWDYPPAPPSSDID